MKRLLIAVALVAATLTASPALAQQAPPATEPELDLSTPSGPEYVRLAVMRYMPEPSEDRVIILLPPEEEDARPIRLDRAEQDNALRLAATFVLEDGSQLDLGLNTANVSEPNHSKIFEWQDRGFGGIQLTIRWF